MSGRWFQPEGMELGRRAVALATDPTDDAAVDSLTLQGLTKRYGDVVALDGLDLEVPGGELFGFVGRNGAGKTTAMRIILGVLSADAGEVRFGGTPLTFEARRRIGYLPEERGLYPKMRLADQLAYLAQLHGMAPTAARVAAATWLERFGLAARARLLDALRGK
jgi:ABC-2 type transport system ATP-binding protein